MKNLIFFPLKILALLIVIGQLVYLYKGGSEAIGDVFWATAGYVIYLDIHLDIYLMWKNSEFHIPKQKWLVFFSLPVICSAFGMISKISAVSESRIMLTNVANIISGACILVDILFVIYLRFSTQKNANRM